MEYNYLLFIILGHSSVMYRSGGLIFPGKKRYEGVRFNVISITWGWVGVKYPGEMRYLTLEQINCQVTDNQCVVKIYRSRSKCRSFVSAIKVKLKLLSS